jgi:hypothetical protein
MVILTHDESQEMQVTDNQHYIYMHGHPNPNDESLYKHGHDGIPLA